MASGIALGRVRTTTTTAATESRIMAAILQEVDRDIKPLFTVYFFDIGHQCYNQLTESGGRGQLCLRSHVIARPMILAFITSLASWPVKF